MQNTLEIKINELTNMQVLHTTGKGKYKLTATYLHGQEKSFEHLKSIAPELHDWIKSFDSPQDFHYCINHDLEHQPVCSICGKKVAMHTGGHYYFYPTTCSEMCRRLQIETSNKLNHGGVWNFQTPEFSDITKQTSLAKYGCEDPAQSEKARESRSKTRKAGGRKKKEVTSGIRDPQCEGYKDGTWNITDYYTQPEEVKQKRKETCLAKYGYENANQCSEIREKTKHTCLEKYGVEHITQSDIFRETYKERSLERYGVSHPWKASTVRSKMKQTWLDKYGVPYPAQSHEVRCKTFAKLRYDNLAFDSYPEVAFYVYCKDNNIIIEREPNVVLEYFDEKRQRTRRYFPDFKVDGKLIEIKSKRWWKESSESYRTFVSSVSEILFEEDYQKYLDYVTQTYGRSYLKQFKICN